MFEDGERRGLILRRDPTGSLIDTDRATEFLAYQSFHGVVPVPEPVALEIDPGPLERPFFIMGRVDGGAAASPIGPDPYGAHAEAIGQELFAILGRIARADPAGLPIARAFDAPALDACWRRELDDLGRRAAARRAPPAAYRQGRAPAPAPQSTAAGAEAVGGAWRLPLRQFPAR